MIKISAVIITLNEEKVIEQTLLALRWCDEVVVVDSGSTDQTLTICARYNCKVVHRKFDGYGAQKQFAVAMASNDWVLSIDADEVLTPELQEEIQLLREKQNLTIKGFFIPRTLILWVSKSGLADNTGSRFCDCSTASTATSAMTLCMSKFGWKVKRPRLKITCFITAIKIRMITLSASIHTPLLRPYRFTREEKSPLC